MESLAEVLSDEPLVHSNSTLAAIDAARLRQPDCSIYFGTGLTTRTELSSGVPFDILIFVLVAEKIRRTLGFKRTYHHIADTHALSNGFSKPAEVARLANVYQDVMLRISNLMDVPLLVKLSSSLDQSEEYTGLLASVKTGKGEYIQRELADILWYRRNHKVRLKLGWLIQDKSAKSGFDERVFDQEFLSCCDADMCFAYTVSGRTFDQGRMRVSPYISIAGESRLLFKRGEDVEAKYVQASRDPSNTENSLRATLSHLEAIMDLWDELSPASIPANGNVLERVQNLINLVCR